MTTPGTTVDDAGRYRLTSRIATGGMGEVWRAEDTVLGREVAVKLLKREYADDPAFRSRFEVEARHVGHVLEERLAAPDAAGTTLLLIEVDGLGEVREDAGRDLALSVLVEIARRLRATVRGDEPVARLGHHLHVGLGVDDLAQPTAHERLVVGQQDADAHRAIGSRACTA